MVTNRNATTDSHQFLAFMGKLRAINPRGYSTLRGILRAAYEENMRGKPAPRGRVARAMHDRSLSKVRPIDRRRAKEFFSKAPAEAAAMIGGAQ